MSIKCRWLRSGSNLWCSWCIGLWGCNCTFRSRWSCPHTVCSWNLAPERILSGKSHMCWKRCNSSIRQYTTGNRHLRQDSILLSKSGSLMCSGSVHSLPLLKRKSHKMRWLMFLRRNRTCTEYNLFMKDSSGSLLSLMSKLGTYYLYHCGNTLELNCT